MNQIYQKFVKKYLLGFIIGLGIACLYMFLFWGTGKDFEASAFFAHFVPMYTDTFYVLYLVRIINALRGMRSFLHIRIGHNSMVRTVISTVTTFRGLYLILIYGFIASRAQFTNIRLITFLSIIHLVVYLIQDILLISLFFTEDEKSDTKKLVLILAVKAVLHFLFIPYFS